jgi:hypothetical protein
MTNLINLIRAKVFNSSSAAVDLVGESRKYAKYAIRSLTKKIECTTAELKRYESDVAKAAKLRVRLNIYDNKLEHIYFLESHYYSADMKNKEFSANMLDKLDNYEGKIPRVPLNKEKKNDNSKEYSLPDDVSEGKSSIEKIEDSIIWSTRL